MIKCSLNPSIPSTLLPKSLFPTFGRSKANERPISMESQAIHGSRSSSESPLLSSSLSMPEPAATTAMLLGREEDQIGNLRSSPSFYGEQREKGSVLSRSLSDTSDSNCNGSLCQQMRRRMARDKPFSSLCSRQRSFSRDVGHAAAETYLLTRLTFKLLRYLGVGYRWISKLLALGFYAMLLMPGFLQVGYYYFFSKQVRRSMVYGDQPRNRLDLYLPTNSDGLKPVVAFVTGGAWIIGYKAWGSLLGKQLSERGIVVACIDYRNFPQGTISDMVEDSSQGISWVCSNISNYGGDPKRIYLMGQSAGAHIAACALLEQAIKESWGRENVSWSVSQIKAYFGLSGGYNLLNLVDHFHKRGLYRSIFLSIMEGEKSLQQFSPEIVVQDPSIRKAVSLLPPIILFHGTGDYSIPSDASVTFADALKSAGAQAESILYEGKTHTDLFLQDPLRGGRDELFENLIAFIYSGNTEALPKDVSVPRKIRLVPEFMLQLARKISPF